MKFTQSQSQAITTDAPDLLVSASAGSGKTTIMIERIARMLTSGEATLEGLLVMTFTNASAADMRIKLRKKLQQLNSPLATQLATAQIGTFHKFCFDLIQTYFNVAEIDPGFDILHEAESYAMQNEILDKVISENYDKCTLAIDTFCAGRKTDDLKILILDVYNFLASLKNPNQWLTQVASSSYQNQNNPSMDKILVNYQKVGQYYFEQFSAFLCDNQFVAQCIEVAKELSLINQFQQLKNFQQPKWTTLKRFDNPDYELFKELRTQFKNELKKLEDIGDVNQHDKTIVQQTIFLVKEFMATFAAEKQRIAKIDFVDMEQFAFKILQNSEIAARLRDKYKHVFVDEYQDTNPVQEQILSLIGVATTFVVGDVKQSIYGFRGSDVSIITNKLGQNQVILLNENFRSHPQILHFVNLVFEKIMTPELGIDYRLTGMFKAGQQNAPTQHPPVEVILVDTSTNRESPPQPTEPYDMLADTASSDETKKLAAQCALVANKINSLTKQGYQLHDIAVLARSSRHMGLLEKTLRRAGIESHTVNKQNVDELFEIALLENFLYATSNFYNDMRLVFCMTQMPFAFTSFELSQIAMQSGEYFFDKITAYIANNKNDLSNKLKHFQTTLDEFHYFSKRHTVVQTCEKFISKFFIVEKLLAIPGGGQMVSNVHRFLNKLRGAAFAQNLARYLYLRENQLLKIELESGGSINSRVSIMTIHKSKGLEFPCVILFDVGANFSNIDKRRFLVIDRECGLCIHSTDLDGYKKTNSIARTGALIAAKNSQVAEEARLLYVALTRAKQRLVIVGCSKIDKVTTNANPHPFEIINSKAYIDMLSPIIFNPVPDPSFLLKTIPLDQIRIDEKPQATKTLSAYPPNPRLVKDLVSTYKLSDQPVAGANTTLKHSVTSLTKMEHDTADIVPRDFFQSKTQDRGIDYGTRFHQTMQNIDFEAGVSSDVNINNCLQILRRFLAGMKINREVAFLQKLSCTSGKKDDAEILVQGVIDLLATNDDRAIMIDYKTTKQSESRLVELYTPQMKMYAQAIGSALSKPVEVYIYSTHLTKLIQIKNF